jgi:hypothetical protein
MGVDEISAFRTPHIFLPVPVEHGLKMPTRSILT